MITALIISILISIFGKKNYILEFDHEPFITSCENLLAKIRNCKTLSQFLFLNNEVNRLRKKYSTKLPYSLVKERISELHAELLNSQYKK